MAYHVLSYVWCLHGQDSLSKWIPSQLTGDDIKAMIQRRIDKKQKEINPHKQNLREVEDHLTVLEALQCALSLITDEEELRKIIAGTRSGP
jgi:hypothetical protein